eukprot:TRINITY_DN18124_c0_g1_i1.p1 TRINITY_DN18124_c0_g1~~TRINITY_DN18124_c0_g1_i1.p1  ORF type:complete len:294 (+),score=42.83 TRINITY_DN18124_c0_g1_i1:46-927(+)
MRVGRRFFCSGFHFAGKINWFPGHMAKAVRQIKEKVRSVDSVLEVRDARIPFTSGNPELETAISENSTHHLIILNKADLADPTQFTAVKRHLTTTEKTCIYTSLKIGKKYSVQKIIPTAVKMLQTRTRKSALNLLIVGVPNVGKSSIINALHSKTKAQVGPRPGVTRHMKSFKVHTNPEAFLVDTPGVMLPHIENVESGLKLALTGAIKDSRVDVDVLVDYMLYALNKRKNKEYLKTFGLIDPAVHAEEFLGMVAKRIGAKGVQGSWNTDTAAQHVIKLFREGKLGRVMLDDF